MVVIGLDWSITSPAWTIIDSDGRYVHHYFVQRNRKNSKKDESNLKVVDDVESKMESFHPYYYPEFDCSMNRFYLLSEALVDSVIAYDMYNMKQALYREYGLIPTVVPSAQWKKHFGLKGNSDKKPIVDLYIERTGNDLYSIFNKKPDIKSLGVMSDIADSYFIAMYALEDSKK